jgi:hypothetical protein
MAGATDDINLQGNAFMDLAEVLRLAGREPEAAAAVREALALTNGRATWCRRSGLPQCSPSSGERHLARMVTNMQVTGSYGLSLTRKRLVVRIP